MAAGDPRLSRRRQLGAIIETTKGTFVAPTERRFLIISPRITPDYGSFTREFLQASISRKGHVITSKPVNLSFTLEVRRTLTGSTVDAVDILLQGCGLASAALTSPTRRNYVPVSALSAQKTLSMTLNMDEFQVSIRGAIGNVQWVGVVGQPMLMEFEFRGLLETAGDVALASITHEVGVPIAFQGINLSFESDTNVCVANLRANLGNQIVPFMCANNSTGIKHFLIGSRDGELTLDPQMTREDEGPNYWDLLEAGTEVAVTFKEGVAASSKWDFSILKAQIKSLSDDERDTIAVAGLTCGMNQTSGDDEIDIDLS